MLSLKLAKGDLVVQLISQIENSGVQVVYLRNYETLPQSIGNDVDLLVTAKRRQTTLAVIREAIKGTGWAVSRIVEFGPLSVFLTSEGSSDFMHIDLFDRIEWHWFEFANADTIIKRRQHNGLVHHPAAEDEIVINLMSQLLYARSIRNKHRDQASHFIDSHGIAPLTEACTTHLGTNVGRLVSGLMGEKDWKTLESLSPQLKRKLHTHQMLRHPASTLKGLKRYFKRAFCRLIRPPGPFLVFEGADGVGKSTIIGSILPHLQHATGRSNTLLFHWKPTRQSIRMPDQAADTPQNPRQQKPRSILSSLVYLAYHWLGFWTGYIRFILPALASNRAVVGDRYAYEFLLDPDRLRLNLPRWILSMAAATVPHPGLVIGLTATPESIVSRKAELSVAEISSYQQLLTQLAASNKNFIIIYANPSADQVRAAAWTAIFDHFFAPTTD